MHSGKRIWADIDVSALRHNYDVIKKAVGNTKILAVVKADGYGHGALETARVFENCGADYLGVATVDEALELRLGGISAPVLIFGRTEPEDVALLCKYGITQTIYSLEYARLISDCARKLGQKVRAHVKIDTGMCRLGFFCREDADPTDEIVKALSLEEIEYEGIFTHFASSDERGGEDFTRKQFALFTDLLSRLHMRGFDFAICHAANSGAVLSFPETYLDMVRPGIILYGLYPDRGIHGACEGLVPAMTLCSRISLVKRIPKGTSVGYSRTETAQSAMLLATVSAGYADGYSTLNSGKGKLSVNGAPARIVGRVCMDQLMVDVTEIPLTKAGDTAVLFGKTFPTADDVAEVSGLLNYEITCAVSKRVPRIYHD